MRYPAKLKRSVAVVGYSYRLPGERDLWPALCQGRDLVTTVDPSRWAQETVYHPRKSEPGKSYTFAAGSIGDISGFDAGFFGLSPREVEQMDPQQRLLLELTWEAFEDAGIRPASMRGSHCAVYIGIASGDYAYRRADDLASFDASTMTGGTASIAANRLSYYFDLRGPSMAVDTACSSTLVAFHQACQSIAVGESTAALVGGVSLHIHPFPFIGFSKASMLSRRGICNVFDARGDGYVRSEGAGVFLLKDLEAALADGDRVLAVVAASGANCDGKTNGMTVPSAEAQAELLREVYDRAGIGPEEIDYLEAHGTGTAVGDPIETYALGAAIGRLRPPARPLPIGSVKSNLGHLEAASAVAGLVKVLLSLQHRQVPPTIHLETPNPNIDFAGWNLHAVTENLPLPASGKLTVGVNSFGFGGANAHVVLQTLEAPPAPETAAAAGDAVALIVSGRSESALRAGAEASARHLREHPEQALHDIAYTAAVHREWHPFRAIVEGHDREALANLLTTFAGQGSAAGVSAGSALAGASRPVFVYSGNGSQWVGMGRTLLGQDRLFRHAVEAVDALFAPQAGFSIIDRLYAEDSEAFAATEIAQPTLFAIQVGLTEMFRGWGVRPGAVLGHSVGEVAAAWAAGALTLAQAVQVIHVRSREQGRTKGAGAMTAVGMAADELGTLLDSLELSARLTVAGINSPRGVTLAGDPAELTLIERALSQKRVFNRRLGLDYAFHSPAMDAIAPSLAAALADLRPAPSRLPFASTVTGTTHDGEALDAEYWWRNVREPVRFEAAIRHLIDEGFSVFVEIGPHAILKNYIGDCLRAAGVDGRALVSMLRSGNDRPALRAALHQIVIAGAAVELERVFPARGERVELPHYPWQRERFWHPVTSESYRLVDRKKEHPLLGCRLHENELQWENHLDTRLYPVYRDHAVGEAVVFPAAGFIEMALAASTLIHGGAAHEVEELEIRAPLLLDEAVAKTVRLSVEGPSGRFVIRSRPRLSDEPWLVHVVGRLLGAPTGGAPASKLKSPRRAADLSGAEHYALTASVGLGYGPAFQAVDRVWCESGGVFARLHTPEAIRGELAETALHPSFLDAAFQLLVDHLRDEIARRSGVAFVPIRSGRLRLYQARTIVAAARARLKRRSPRSLVADFDLYDSSGELVAELIDVRFRGVHLKRAAAEHLCQLAFRAVPMPRPGQRAQALLPGLGELSARCTAQLHGAADLPLRRRYQREVEPLLDVLCTAFADHALRQLTGNTPDIDPAALLAGGAVAGERAALLFRLLRMLQEDGQIEPTDGGWRWSPDAELPDAGDSWITLLGDYPDEAAQLLPIGRIGSHLGEILKSDPGSAALAPPFGGGRRFTELLANSRFFANAGRALAEVIAEAVRALPSGQRLRILEITPCATELGRHLRAAIDPDRCDHVIACTTADAVDDFATRLDELAGAQVVSFEIDKPGAGLPETCSKSVADRGGENSCLECPDAPPEFCPNAFDLVVVADGLIGARNTAAALDNLARLTASEGTLVLLGQTPARWADLVFGAAPEWWSGRTPEEALSRLRSPLAWQSLLPAHGFAQTAVVAEIPDQETGAYLLLSRRQKVVASGERTLAKKPGIWVLVQDRDGYSAALAASVRSELRSRGHAVTEVAPENGGSEEFAAALAQTCASHGEITGLVDLYGLQAAGSDDPAAMLERQTRRAESLLHLLQACSRLEIRPPLWLVTAGAMRTLLPEPGTGAPRSRDAGLDEAPLWGLGRTAMNEFAETRIRLVDCAEPEQLERMSAGLVRELLEPDGEDEIILTAAGRHALRLGNATRAATTLPAAKHVVRLDFAVPGPLKNLSWRHERLRPPAAGEVEIEVRAAGLNFRDVMYAMGLLADEAVENGFAGATLGMEMAGVVVGVGPQVSDFAAGDEVIAFAPASFASRVVTSANAVVRKPREWSFEAGATVPTAFFTVYYALHHLARLEEGERLLIHGAAGAVGIAAIQFAKLTGAEIFATAGSDEKRDIVRLLGADHVLDSRSLAFADDILRLTGGEGVDVVLNSLAGEAIARNLRVLRPFGRFLELGKRDFYENTQIGLRPFRNNITYFGIDADQLMRERPDLTRRLFQELMAFFARGELKPLPFRAFPASEAVEAFRYMQQSRQIGKIVLSFRDPLKAPRPADAAPRALALPAAATYLVTGGLGGFGLKTAQWLASRGARQLVLLGRRGLDTPEAAAGVAALTAAGVAVSALACDVTDRAALAAVLAEIKATLPPLRGIVHAAMVIDDALLRNMSGEQVRRVLAPKVLGARHLDELTRELELDFFVLYSSATTLFGNPGQGNYVGANLYLEALARARRAAGRPALCVGWGAIADAGYLARNEQIKEALQSRMGGAALESATALAVLEQLLLADTSGVGVLELDWKALRRFLPTAQSPRYSELARQAEDDGENGEGSEELERWLEELSDAELTTLFTDILRKEVGEILRLPPDRLDVRRSLYDMGMDSLMGVELVTAVEARFGINLPVMALSEGPTIERLVERILRQLRGHGESAEDGDSEQSMIRHLAAQHADQHDAALLDEVTQDARR